MNNSTLNKENISLDLDRNDNELNKTFAKFFLKQLKKKKLSEKEIMIRNQNTHVLVHDDELFKRLKSQIENLTY